MCLLWFFFITLCNWSKRLAPLSQLIRSNTKTNRDLLACVFPRLAPVTRIRFISFDWFIVLFAAVVIGHTLFKDTHLKSAHHLFV